MGTVRGRAAAGGVLMAGLAGLAVLDLAVAQESKVCICMYYVTYG